MINLTDEQKKLFYTSGNFKDYVFTFSDIDFSVTNDTIHQESVVINETLCDSEDLMLGGCIASSIEFEVSEILEKDLSGLEFSAELYVNLKEDGTCDLKLPMGVYRVDSAKMVDEKDYKKVVAYDAMYDASVDVSDWYNEYFAKDATHTVKETREALLDYLGISYAKQTLINDNVPLEKTLDTTELTGTVMLKALCTINGGFGRMNREGKFVVLSLRGLGLFPEDGLGAEENLYPEETLYPEDHFEYIGISDENNVYPEYQNTFYEEYVTMPITCLNIRSTDDDIGVTVGNDFTNPYVISTNFLLYGKTTSELRSIGEKILSQIKGITYRPNTTTLDGLPYMETGDIFSLKKNKDAIESYIFSRTLTGVQALTDTYEAKGNYIRANEASANDEIVRLKGKSLEIKKSIDGLSADLTDFEKGTSARFELTDEAISSEVKRAKGEEGKLSSRIQQTVSSISLTVNNGEKTAGIVIKLENEDGSTSEVKGTVEMTGIVTFKNLENEGQTVINGSNITTGSINCNLLSGGVINGQSIHGCSVYGTEVSGGKITGGAIDGGTITGSTIETDSLYINGGNGVTLRSMYGYAPLLQMVDTALNYLNLNPASGSIAGHSIVTSAWEDSAGGYGKVISTGGYRIPSVSFCDSKYEKASDYRIKKNITDLPECIDDIFDDFKPIQYEFKDDIKVPSWKGKNFGMRAQSIENILKKHGLDPEEYHIVGTRPVDDGLGEENYIIDGKLHYINTDDVVWMCVDQIQKLKEEIKELKHMLNASTETEE